MQDAARAPVPAARPAGACAVTLLKKSDRTSGLHWKQPLTIAIEHSGE